MHSALDILKNNALKGTISLSDNCIVKTISWSLCVHYFWELPRHRALSYTSTSYRSLYLPYEMDYASNIRRKLCIGHQPSSGLPCYNPIHYWSKFCKYHGPNNIERISHLFHSELQNIERHSLKINPQTQWQTIFYLISAVEEKRYCLSL